MSERCLSHKKTDHISCLEIIFNDAAKRQAHGRNMWTEFQIASNLL